MRGQFLNSGNLIEYASVRLGDGEKRISGYYSSGAARTSPQIELPDNNHAGDDLRCHS